MNNLDLLAIGARNLWRRKLRTFLTVLGVVIGVTAIIIMLSFGLGIDAQNQKMIASMGDVTTITIHQKDQYGGYYGPDMAQQTNTTEEVLLDPTAVMRIGQMPNVHFVSPVVETNVTLQYKKKQSNVQVMGFDERYLEEFGITPAEGRAFQPGETMTAIAGSWVSQNFWDPTQTNYYGPPEALDLMNIQLDMVLADWIEVQQPSPFDDPEQQPSRPPAPKYKIKVSGIMSDTTYEYGNTLIMPIGEVEKIKKEKDAYTKKLNAAMQQEGASGGFMGDRQSQGNKNKYSRILVKVDDVENVESVQNELRAQGYMTSSLLDIATSVAEQARVIQMILGGIGAVSLLVAAIGIMNTMVMSIYERTKEIGVMKVIGASIANIRNMFLIEASLIGLLGGIFGVGLSLLGSKLINTVLPSSAMFGGGMDGEAMNLSIIPLWLIVLALLFSIAIGVISGYYPAVRATRLSALEAMRNE